jgi:hypothetical protein
MELISKYKINDTVYFMRKNEIWGGKVYRYRFTVDDIWYMQTDNCKNNAHNNKLEITIEYQICTNENEKKGNKWIRENKLFKTIEEIIKDITENCNF